MYKFLATNCKVDVGKLCNLFYFQPNFLRNLNGDDAGDSSDPDDSDIEDDSEEEDEGNDSGEADSLDEDEEGVESASDDEDDDFFADEEEEEEDDIDNETSNKNKNIKEIKDKTAAKVKADRDSGIDELPQTKTKVTKVKNKTTNDKHKLTTTKEKDASSTVKDLSSTTTPSPSIAAPPSIAPAPSSSSVPEEYAEDSSDEEDLRNTIGKLSSGFVCGGRRSVLSYFYFITVRKQLEQKSKKDD